jgi:hypothetical protein
MSDASLELLKIQDDETGRRGQYRRCFTLYPSSCQLVDPGASNAREEQWLTAINTAPCMRVR